MQGKRNSCIRADGSSPNWLIHGMALNKSFNLNLEAPNCTFNSSCDHAKK